MTRRTGPARQMPEVEAILPAHHLDQMIDGSSGGRQPPGGNHHDHVTAARLPDLRAHDNRAYVRRLLGKRDPAFAAALAAAEQDFDPQLIAFMLPSIPESVRIARFHVRAALSFHGLDEYADDAETITSELVTNAIQHVCVDKDETISVTLARVWCPASVAVVVADSSSQGPVLRKPSDASEHGQGLQIVEGLSVRWGWHLEPGGKAIFAILARERSCCGDVAATEIVSPVERPARRS